MLVRVGLKNACRRIPDFLVLSIRSVPFCIDLNRAANTAFSCNPLDDLIHRRRHAANAT